MAEPVKPKSAHRLSESQIKVTKLSITHFSK